MDILPAALGYAARGWPVFPCDPETKRPLVAALPGAAKGSGGLKRATLSEELIRGWWKKWPKAMIGVPTGAAIAAFVVDVDAGVDPDSGEVVEANDLVLQLMLELGVKSLPTTLTVTTPRGGRHLYFAMPAGAELGNRAGIIPRVDVRGEGGYVIVPPSARTDSKAYSFVGDPMKPAPAPEVLLDLILRRGKWNRGGDAETLPAGSKSPPRKHPPKQTDKGDPARRYALAALDTETQNVQRAGPGTRSGALNEAAFNLGQLVAAGVLVESVVRAALEAASIDNGHVAKDGLNATRATISSGLRAGMAQPRDLKKIRDQAERRATRSGPGRASRVLAGKGDGPPPARPLPEPAASDQLEMRDVLRQQRRRNDPPPEEKRGGAPPGKWTPDRLGLPREDPCPVVPLGIEGRAYHFLDSAGQYTAITKSDMTQAGIQDLFAATPYWPEWAAPRYGKAKKDPDTGAIIYPIASHQGDDIRKMLFRACVRKGHFSAEQKIRGRGAWKLEDGRIVYHAGEELWVVEGVRVRPLETGIVPDGERELVFPRMSALPPPWPKPVTLEDNPARQLLQGFKSWTWERPDIDPVLLLGWVGVAFLGGALDWRSAVFLVGDAGSGKSSLQAALKDIFGDALLDSANTTAAGIYQALSHDSRPVAVDEIEGGADNRKVAAIVELARQASSGAFGRRGASDARAHGVEFQMRSAFLFSAINTPPLLPQDLSRLAMLRLRKLSENAERAGAPPAVDVDTCGRMILTRLLTEWHRFPATLRAYREQLAGGGHNGRGQDTYGNLLACADLIIGPELADELKIPMVDDLSPWATLLHVSTLPEVGDAIANWQSCVNHMLQSRVEVWRSGERATVGQLLEDLMTTDGIEVKYARRQLAQAGLGLVIDPALGYLLAVPNQSPMLERLFWGSRWQGAPGAGGWSEAMRQAPTDVAMKSAEANRVRINGVQQRCTLLVLKAIGISPDKGGGGNGWAAPAASIAEVAATLPGSIP